MEEKETLPDFDIDNENIKTFIDKLSADLNSQKNFINYLNQIISQTNSGSKESAKKLEKIAIYYLLLLKDWVSHLVI